jgi:O-antigen/teichoic acid export membrane protein
MIKLIKKVRNISDDRYKQAIKTSAISFLAQGIQMITAVVSVPLVLGAVGNERYGLWMTLSSILLFVTFSDFGMGIGMQNIMSYAKANNDEDKLSKALTTTLTFGAAMFSILMLTSYFVLPFVGLANLFKYQDKSIANEILPTTQAVFLVLSFGILSGLVQRVFDAYQQGYYPRIILVISRVFSLGLLYWAVKTGQSLSTIVLVSSGVPNLVLALSIFFLYKKYSYLTYSFKNVDKLMFQSIFKTGVVGLGAAIAIFLVSSITPMIISSNYGLKESAKYLILMRLLNFVILFVNMVFMPLWPAVADAYSKQDAAWLNSLYKKVNRLFLMVGGPIFLILMFGSKWLIILWTHNYTILPSFSMTVFCVLYVVLSVWNTIICVFLNGMSIFKGQASFGIAIAALSLFTVYFLKHYIDASGVVLIITIGMLIRCIYLQYELRTAMNKKFVIIKNV